MTHTTTPPAAPHPVAHPAGDKTGACHTPGPWRVLDEHPEHCSYTIMPANPGADRLAPMYTGIAHVWRHSEQPTPDFQLAGPNYAAKHLANARLIAAAPDLLQAVKQLIGCGTFISRKQLGALAFAQGAIARAEGHNV